MFHWNYDSSFKNGVLWPWAKCTQSNHLDILCKWKKNYILTCSIFHWHNLIHSLKLWFTYASFIYLFLLMQRQGPAKTSTEVTANLFWRFFLEVKSWPVKTNKFFSIFMTYATSVYLSSVRVTVTFKDSTGMFISFTRCAINNRFSSCKILFLWQVGLVTCSCIWCIHFFWYKQPLSCWIIVKSVVHIWSVQRAGS